MVNEHSYETPLTISQDHIDNGIPECPNQCVVANALWEHFGKLGQVSWLDVGYFIWKVKMRNGDYYSGNIPETARKLIRNFDDRIEVEPCTITFYGHKVGIS